MYKILYEYERDIINRNTIKWREIIGAYVIAKCLHNML